MVEVSIRVNKHVELVTATWPCNSFSRTLRATFCLSLDAIDLYASTAFLKVLMILLSLSLSLATPTSICNYSPLTL